MLTINHLPQVLRFSYNGNIRNYSCVYPANLGGYTQRVQAAMRCSVFPSPKRVGRTVAEHCANAHSKDSDFQKK